MKKREIEEIGFSELKYEDLQSIQGGSWLGDVIDYIVDEIKEGVERGLATDCSEYECPIQ